MKFSKIPNGNVLLEKFRCIKLIDDVLKLIIEFWYDEKWFLLLQSKFYSPYDDLRIFTMNDKQIKYLKREYSEYFDQRFHQIDLNTFLPKNIKVLENYAEGQIKLRKQELFHYHINNYSWKGRVLNELCKKHVNIIKLRETGCNEEFIKYALNPL